MSVLMVGKDWYLGVLAVSSRLFHVRFFIRVGVGRQVVETLLGAIAILWVSHVDTPAVESDRVDCAP